MRNNCVRIGSMACFAHPGPRYKTFHWWEMAAGKCRPGTHERVGFPKLETVLKELQPQTLCWLMWVCLKKRAPPITMDDSHFP